MQGLQIGRVVVFTTDAGHARPALVNEVHDDDAGVVSLNVFTNPAADGQRPGWFVERVPFDPKAGANTWTWPPSPVVPSIVPTRAAPPPPPPPPTTPTGTAP